MFAALAVVASLLASDTVPTPPPVDSVPAVSSGPRLDVLYGAPFAPLAVTVAADTSPRPRAVEYSDGYYTRLKIHRIASWTMLPLFVTQYAVGEDLYRNGSDASSFSRNWHGPLAAAIGGVFAVQAVTGIWNMVDSWHDPNGRTRRVVHEVTMLLASAGFVATAATAPELERETGNYVFASEGDRSLHKGLAIGSMALATASWLMMLIWKD